MIIIIKHISIEGPGIIAEVFKDRSFNIKTIELEKGDKLHQNLDQIEAVIILGGPMNVYEEEKFPFLKDEDEFIKKLLAKDIPFLGICLGAQLLAKACSAKVTRAEQKEIGYYKVSLTKDGMQDPLFYGLGKELDVFQWHEDTFEIPRGEGLLATSEFCKNQAFRFGKSAYGLQFHIEVTPDMVKSWIEAYIGEKNQDISVNIKKMIADSYEKKEEFEKDAKRILMNFSKLI